MRASFLFACCAVMLGLLPGLCDARQKSATEVQVAPAPADRIAGEIFGVPVPVDNYYFARRVAAMFPPPWGAAGEPPQQQEQITWDSLVLHFEGFREGVSVADEEMESRINEFLKGNKQSFTRAGDPEAYKKWVIGYVGEEVELFENQIRYLSQIKKLRDKIYAGIQVTAADEEMEQEFLNEKHHIGGEMVIFEKKEEAQVFYEQVKESKAWKKFKKQDEKKPQEQQQVKPVSLMTLEAYIELWGVPKDQIYAVHAMKPGSVAPPMPFGTKWCVYRVLEKRAADLKEFPKEREYYRQQIEQKKRFIELNRKISELIQSSNRKSFMGP